MILLSQGWRRFLSRPSGIPVLREQPAGSSTSSPATVGASPIAGAARPSPRAPASLTDAGAGRTQAIGALRGDVTKPAARRDHPLQARPAGTRLLGNDHQSVGQAVGRPGLTPPSTEVAPPPRKCFDLPGPGAMPRGGVSRHRQQQGRHQDREHVDRLTRDNRGSRSSPSSSRRRRIRFTSGLFEVSQGSLAYQRGARSTQ